MGLEPKSLTKGPVFIRRLAEQNVIDSMSATIVYNSFESQKPSNLILGRVSEADSIISGNWQSHNLIMDDFTDYKTFSLNV